MGFLRKLSWIIVALLLVGCGQSSRGPDCLSAPDCIVFGLPLEPAGFDPHIHTSRSTGVVVRQIYDTLIYRDPVTQDYVPGLATSWQVSEDLLTYTFTLRDGVTFHDGSAFTAQSVASNLDRIMTAEVNARRARLALGPYVGYIIVDPMTIQLTLSEPYTALLDALSHVELSIANPKVLDTYSTLRYQFHQSGTGAFRLVEYLPGNRIVIERNDAYEWAPQFLEVPETNAIRRVEFRFFADAEQRARALESGETNVATDLLSNDARSFTGNSQYTVLPAIVPGQPLQFFMNTRQFPTDNVLVRRALILATNRNAIVDSVFESLSSAAWGPLSEQTLFFNRSLRGVYNHDIGQSQSLLATVGYSDSDGDGWLDIGGVPLEVTMIVPPWESIPDVARMIQSQWRTIGIRVVIEPVPGLSAIQEKVATGKYNLVAYNEFGLDPSVINSWFLSDGRNNWTGYGTVELDLTLIEGSRQVNAEQRRNLYGQAQLTIMDQALILPIRDYVNLNAFDADLQGMQFEPNGWYPLLYGLHR